MRKVRILERKYEARVFFKYRGNYLSRTVARWIYISSFWSPSNKSTKQIWYYQRLSSYLRIWGFARTFWRSLWKDLEGSVPGCGEYSVDNWILWVLGAHEKHILWKYKVKMGEGEVFQQHLKECVRSTFLHLQIRTTHLRSSSKCVSMPLTPGTEHISRALRKVVHLFTRLLWPPMSFCITHTQKTPIHFCKFWHKHVVISLRPCRYVRNDHG